MKKALRIVMIFVLATVILGGIILVLNKGKEV